MATVVSLLLKGTAKTKLLEQISSTTELFKGLGHKIKCERAYFIVFKIKNDQSLEQNKLKFD